MEFFCILPSTIHSSPFFILHFTIHNIIVDLQKDIEVWLKTCVLCPAANRQFPIVSINTLGIIYSCFVPGAFVMHQSWWPICTMLSPLRTWSVCIRMFVWPFFLLTSKRYTVILQNNCQVFQNLIIQPFPNVWTKGVYTYPHGMTPDCTRHF